MKYTLRVKIDNMHCASCVNRIENILRRLGADEADVNISRGFGLVKYRGEEDDAEVYVEGIESLGYAAKKLSVSSEEDAW